MNFIIDQTGSFFLAICGSIWTSIMIRDVIQAEFSVNYHPGHIRKLLNNIGFSVQKPKTRANEEEKQKWRRYTYPNIKKKPIN